MKKKYLLLRKPTQKVLARHNVQLFMHYSEHTDGLLESLKSLVEVMTDCEQDFIRKIDEEVMQYKISH